jgi:2-dehydro-3-deoxygluconokinase
MGRSVRLQVFNYQSEAARRLLDNMKKKVITLGDVMIRLSPPGFGRLMQANQFNVWYAGSEANVACSLSLLGIPSAHVTRFPGHDLGKAATQALARYGVDTQHIIYSDGRLGVYYLENGAMHRSPRIVYDRYDSAFAFIQPGMIDWEEVMKDAQWFHWSGITPALSAGAAAVCREGLLMARKKGLTVSADINYRRNLWQYGKAANEVMPELIGLSDLVVGGLADFENCLGISAKNFEEGCNQVMKAKPAVKKIAFTQRTSISASHNKIKGLWWNGRELMQSREYELTHIVDRIGAGDAFMAGLIYGAVTGKHDQPMIDFATAACAMKHAIEGDVNLATAGEIESLARGENTGQLLR